MKTTIERLEEVGVCALASIRELVAALECDYDRIEELRDERDGLEASEDQALTEVQAEWDADNGEELRELEAAANCNGEPCESREDAEQRIQEDALSVEFRSGWVSLGEPLTAEHFCILLGTGGPAMRIVGDLENGKPTSATLEVQNWGTPWTYHSGHDDLLTYARCFYFGE